MKILNLFLSAFVVSAFFGCGEFDEREQARNISIEIQEDIYDKLEVLGLSLGQIRYATNINFNAQIRNSSSQELVCEIINLPSDIHYLGGKKIQLKPKSNQNLLFTLMAQALTGKSTRVFGLNCKKRTHSLALVVDFEVMNGAAGGSPKNPSNSKNVVGNPNPMPTNNFNGPGPVPNLGKNNSSQIPTSLKKGPSNFPAPPSAANIPAPPGPPPPGAANIPAPPGPPPPGTTSPALSLNKDVSVHQKFILQANSSLREFDQFEIKNPDVSDCVNELTFQLGTQKIGIVSEDEIAALKKEAVSVRDKIVKGNLKEAQAKRLIAKAKKIDSIFQKIGKLRELREQNAALRLNKKKITKVSKLLHDFLNGKKKFLDYVNHFNSVNEFKKFRGAANESNDSFGRSLIDSRNHYEGLIQYFEKLIVNKGDNDEIVVRLKNKTAKNPNAKYLRTKTLPAIKLEKNKVEQDILDFQALCDDLAISGDKKIDIVDNLILNALGLLAGNHKVNIVHQAFLKYENEESDTDEKIGQIGLQIDGLRQDIPNLVDSVVNSAPKQGAPLSRSFSLSDSHGSVVNLLKEKQKGVINSDDWELIDVK